MVLNVGGWPKEILTKYQPSPTRVYAESWESSGQTRYPTASYSKLPDKKLWVTSSGKEDGVGLDMPKRMSQVIPAKITK